MSVKIIKTSAQSKIERAKYKLDSTCPECGYSLNLSTYHYEGGGLFKSQIKVNSYTCMECGCQWEVRQ